MKISPLISVIVPVYNVQQYLRQCVDSIIGQTYSDLEIILVDDGSTDGSGRICDEYARQDARVSVIHKENGGLSSARNAGIELARGERVLFIDSDDYWAVSDLLEVIVNSLCDENLVIWRYRRCKEDENLSLSKGTYQIKQFNLEEDYRYLFKTGALFASACYLAIPRIWFSNQRLRFEINALSEDVEWFAEVLSMVRDITLIDAPLYVYRMRQNSISNTGSKRALQCSREHIANLKAKCSGLPSMPMRVYLAEQTANYYIILSRSRDAENRRLETNEFVPLLDYVVRLRSKVIRSFVRVVGLNGALYFLRLLDYLI